MYIYRVIVSDYEDHTELWFQSNSQYSKDDFRSIVKECLDKTIEYYCNLDDYKWDVPCLVDMDNIIRYQRFTELMEDNGFSRLKVEAGCGFTNHKVFSKDDDSDYKITGNCGDCFREDSEYFDGCELKNLKG